MSNLSKEEVPQLTLSLIPRFIWKYKVFIFCFTSFWSALMVGYAISKPNIYTAKGLYMPKGAESGGSLAKLAGQFGGLASMAGINIGKGSTDKTDVALELLKSRAFLQSFIEKHNLTVALLAVEKWDKSTDQLIIDPKLYDAEKKVWVREVPEGKSVIPTPWEAYSKLSENISVDYASKKGTLSIELSYYSPKIAAEWLDLLIKEMNLFWQEKTQRETEKYITLLKEKAVQTGNSELQSILYGLIGEQTKILLLNNITDEVMFETVGPIIVPEEKSAPSRALLCIIAFIFSGFISVIIAVFYGLDRQAKSQVTA
ncbi:LPS O-antigen length regulator [Thalassotalea fusca]